MYSDSGLTRLFLLTLTAFIIAAGSASALSIDIPDTALNPDTSGNQTSTVRVVNITDNGEMLNESDVGNDFVTNFTYNQTNGTDYMLEHLSQGYWFAELEYNTSEGSYVQYTIEEKEGTQDTAQTNEELNTSGLGVELMSSVSNRLTPGEDVNLRVNVTDLANDEPETSAEVEAYFTNGSNQISLQGLNNQDGSEYYNSQINTPENYGGKYILHINASETSGSKTGVYSIPVQMEPPMTGEITALEARSGCDQSSFFAECERGATIETDYNVTGATPNSVNLSIQKYNRTSDEWVTHSSMGMQNNSVYEATVTVPDLNTTAYSETIRMVYNASNDEVNAVETYDVTVRDYQIKFGATGTARQGGDYSLEIAFEKYFSTQPVDPEKMDADINITNSTDVLLNYSLSDMEYDNGVFQLDVPIGSEWEEGTYNVELNATDDYNNIRTAEDSFYVEEVNRTFDVVEEIDEEVVTAGTYDFNMTLENLGSSELNLTANASEDIEDITMVDRYVILPGDDNETDVPVEFNLTGMDMEDDYTGEIVLDDGAGFNESVDVDLEVPDCDYREGVYCLSGELNNSQDSRGSALNQFTLYYMANQSDEQTVEPGVEGNVSEIVSFNIDSVEMNSSNSQHEFVMNYTANSPGYFTGTLSVGTLSVPIGFDSNVESTDLSISVPPSLDLGTIAETEESVESELEVENTGDVNIESVSFTSGSMEVDTLSAEISPGSTHTFDLEFSEVEDSGSMTVTADSGSQSTDATVEVEVEVIPDLTERTPDLRDQLDRLQTQVSTTENQNTLNTAEINITDINNLYPENPEEAQQVYAATSASLDRVEAEVSSTSTDPEETDTGSPSTDDPATETPSTMSEGSGTRTLLIVGIVVFVLLIIGFVVFTSYVPEEGDPLYGVLGE